MHAKYRLEKKTCWHYLKPTAAAIPGCMWRLSHVSVSTAGTLDGRPPVWGITTYTKEYVFKEGVSGDVHHTEWAEHPQRECPVLERFAMRT
jgi:hypothetical protein